MELIRKSKKELIELPFEVGQSYVTKMATGESFTIDRIELDAKSGRVRNIIGRYDKSPDLRNCPISPDRLIARVQETGNILNQCFCPHCNEQVKE